MSLATYQQVVDELAAIEKEKVKLDERERAARSVCGRLGHVWKSMAPQYGRQCVICGRAVAA